MSERPIVELWTDGGCKPNPGPGAWAFVLIYGQHTKEACGYDPDTTNNRMELTAVIEGLKALKFSCNVTIFSDSELTSNCAQRLWKRKKNTDLWPLYDEIAAQHAINWKWVKGHNGIH